MSDLDVAAAVIELPVAAIDVPAVMDIEASGFGSGSYPIEIGYTLGDGRSYCSLIQPLEHWTHWDDEACQLHGITRDTLIRHGRPAIEVATILNETLSGLTIYSDGWSQDQSWLLTLYDSVGIWPTFKLETIRKIISEEQVVFWHQAHNQAQDELQIRRHRASSDARLIQQAYSISQALANNARLIG